MNIKRGIKHCVLVRPSRYKPTPTSKNGAKLPTKQYREIGTETHNAITKGEPKNIKGKPTSKESNAKIGIKYTLRSMNPSIFCFRSKFLLFKTFNEFLKKHPSQGLFGAVAVSF